MLNNSNTHELPQMAAKWVAHCPGLRPRSRGYAIVILAVWVTASCTNVEIVIITPTLTPAQLPYPYALDVMLVHEEVTAAVNEARAERGIASLQWDETLQELAEWQAWQVIKGAVSFDELDDFPATQLGEPVIELRACLSDDVTTPEAVTQVVVEHWLADPELREMLLGRWQRIGRVESLETRDYPICLSEK